MLVNIFYYKGNEDIVIEIILLKGQNFIYKW